MDLPRLFRPVTLRGVTARNPIVISPMCQYSAVDGVPDDWHLVHLGGFAKGGAGIVFAEATAVVPEGRITHGDTGLWNDAQVAAFRRITDFVKGQGAVPAVQLGHAGRKASMQRPWYGNGPLGPDDAARGDRPWPIVGPTEAPLDEGWLVPAALSEAEILALVARFAEAARRALAAGFEIAEVHAAHGYLLQTFLSPLSNTRSDGWGGDLAGRMRFPLEVARAVRAAWPENKPLFVRISSVDGLEGGWELADSLALAAALKPLGVDVIDCSSGGNSPKGATNASLARGPGFQVPFAEAIRRETGLRTMAVGLILDGPQAEAILAEGRADLVAIGREALYDPFWPLHQARAMGLDLDDFALWPEQYGWWLAKRESGFRAQRAAKRTDAAE